MKYIIPISIALLAILTVSMIPSAFSFCIPPNLAGDDGKWELFGPHIAGIKIHIYSTLAAEMNDMGVGTLDLEDWALGTAQITAWSPANGPITLQNYGGEAGYYLIDINNNATYENPAGSGNYVHNPTSEIALRRAIAWCTDRKDLVTFSGGLALPMYTDVPNYMGGYINNAVPHYANPDGSANTATAEALLIANGYTKDGNGYYTSPVTGQEINLIFYARQDANRARMGETLNTNLNAIHIKTTFSEVARVAVTGPVFANETFNLYTGGWTGIGPDPDFLCDLYNGSNYYHPGSPPNYDGVNYPETNHNATTIKLAPDLVTGTAATMDFQYWYAFYAAGVPVFSTSGVKGYKNVPTEGGGLNNMDPVTYPPTGDWKHLVNSIGVGVNSWWSTLDMQTYGNIYPGINARYGFSSTVTLQNMVYVQWFWDQEVVGRIYDGGWGRDPYTLLWTVPQLYKAYAVGSWVDPKTGETKTYVNITLRCGMYWQDGQPITIADVYYTLVEISKDLLGKGFPPPWWYPTVQYMRSVEIIDDYNMQILLDVQSAWAAGWVIGSVVIPKHIWKPIVDASTLGSTNANNVDAVTPDPNIIGSGPFKWFTGDGTSVSSDIVLVANTAGAQDHWHNTTSPGYYLLEPVSVDINPPNNLVKVNGLPTDASVTIPIQIVLKNLWTDGYLIVNKYVYFGTNLTKVNAEDPSTLVPGFPVDETLTTVTPYPLGTGNVEVINVTMFKHQCPYYIKVAVHIKGPAPINYTEAWDSTNITYTIANPWISHWVNQTIPLFFTIKQDIAGTTWFDVMGYGGLYSTTFKSELPAPDQKCDIKDIAAASKAFGTQPGWPGWSPVADVVQDYKIDIRDIANIAKQFGY